MAHGSLPSTALIPVLVTGIQATARLRGE